MKVTKYHLNDSRYSLQAVLTQCGADINLQICGGEKHHIGALALAVPRPSLADAAKPSASVSVLCVTGHKDDEFAHSAAQTIATRTGRLANVGVGIHIEDATKEDILRLHGNFMRLLDAVLDGLGATAAESFGPNY